MTIEITDVDLYTKGHEAGIDVVNSERNRGLFRSYKEILKDVAAESDDYRNGFIDALDDYF